MENVYYRDNLARVLERFPNKELLTVKEVGEFTGLNVRTVKKWFPFFNNRISAATLARCMCGDVKR